MRDIKNAKLSKTKLHKTTIRDSELHNVEVYNCTIYNSTFIKSKMFDCNIFKSTFKSCELYGAKLVKCGFDDTIMKPAPPCLSKLPVEVRDMIFGLVLDDFELAIECTHPFLAALRGNTELYMQAVEIFNKLNVFEVDCETLDKFMVGEDWSLSENVLRGIKRFCDGISILYVDTDICYLSGVIELNLDVSPFIGHGEFSERLLYNSSLRHEVDNALSKFKTLKKLSASTAGIPSVLASEFVDDPELYGTLEEPKWVDAIQLVSNQLGINVQVIETIDMDFDDMGGELPPRIRDHGEIIWLWEAKRGETLKWKE